jgi:2-oxoisovalerate dehydrogenase E1 component
VHAKVIRPYSHSLSDDEKLYKTAGEREAEARARSDHALPALLVEEGSRPRTSSRLAAESTREVNEPRRRGARAPKPAGRDTATLYVYSPDVDPTSEQFDTEDDPSPEGKPDTMVGLRSTAR